MKRAILVLALVWPSIGISEYEHVNGSDLFSWCEEPSTVYCAGYLLGVADSLNVHHDFCLPDAITVREMRSVFLVWGQENVARLHEKASVLVEEAFKQTWPCKS